MTSLWTLHAGYVSNTANGNLCAGFSAKERVEAAVARATVCTFVEIYGSVVASQYPNSPLITDYSCSDSVSIAGGDYWVRTTDAVMAAVICRNTAAAHDCRCSSALVYTSSATMFTNTVSCIWCERLTVALFHCCRRRGTARWPASTSSSASPWATVFRSQSPQSEAGW